MRIEADWLTQSETQSVLKMLGRAGHQAFVVGGCVRNALLDAPVADIDVSTSALPDVVIELAKENGYRAIPTGLEHGTVTVIIGDVPFEITTFRRDIETDGRRAVVAFSDSVEDDALRRDFTMNALYADADGQVHDPLGGLPDLTARRVRFIEDADTRIREDYLRSLRYFRFHAWYGDADQGFDQDALDAIARNLDGLESLSRERVGSEMKRLLAAIDPVQAVAGMRSTGVLSAILPGADDTALGPLVLLEADVGLSPDPVRRLAALGGSDVATRLRLSRKDASRLDQMRGAIGQPVAALGYGLGFELGRDVYLLDRALASLPIDRADLERLLAASKQVFPVEAADLMPGFSGPALGEVLKRLKQDWIDSDFTLSRESLLKRATKG